MLFYVNTYGSYKLSKNIPVFWPTLYIIYVRKNHFNFNFNFNFSKTSLNKQVNAKLQFTNINQDLESVLGSVVKLSQLIQDDSIRSNFLICF